ncbi:MAG TPA: branched-chain amino acid ABC transporter permease [Stellaceae bacterium]|nr:branched-chain amino acid ABC transporter permease [Stellaceae bacterium]
MRRGLSLDRRFWINGAVWLLLLAAPLWLPLIGGYMELASRVLIYGLAAMAVNLLIGFTGCMTFGEAAYFGLGGYGAGLMLTHVTNSTPLAVLVGTLVGGMAALIFGPLVMRRRGIYFAMITVAIGQIFYFIAERWNSFTGGEDGLSGFSRTPLHLGSLSIQLTAVPFYYFVLLCFAIGAAILALLLHSPLGHTFVAIRENRRRAQFLGIHVERYVWASFAIAGFIAALAGSLIALEQNFISPINLYWVESGNLVIMAVMGGMRSFWGPLVGAIIFIGIQDYVSSFFPNNWETFIGALFIIAVVFFPKGILGIARRRRRVA